MLAEMCMMKAVCGSEKEMMPEGWINIIKIDFSLIF